MSKENAVQTVNTHTGEIVADRGFRDNLVHETPQYKIRQSDDGKFYRNMKYGSYSSINPQTRQEKIDFMNMIDSDDDSLALKNHIGSVIEVAHIVTRFYDKLDEDTGYTEDGANTFLITPDGKAYVTSSKSVYVKINEIMEYLGTPDSEDWENIFVEVYEGAKQEHGKPIKIKLVNKPKK